jgi:hypothetical protein
MTTKGSRRELVRHFILVVALEFAVLAAGCGARRTPTLSPTVTASTTPTMPAPTSTFTPSPVPTTTPTSTPQSPSPFVSLPLEPQGHAAVMIPSAVQYLDGLEDAPRYQIQATFEPDTLTLRGTERVRMVNRSSQLLTEAYFRLYPNASSLYGPARMDLASVTDDAGQPLQWEQEADASVVRVELPDEWRSGEALLMNLTWMAQIPTDETRTWTREDGYGLFRQAKGTTILAEWFPMLAVYENDAWRLDKVPDWGDPVYSEIAFYEVWITAPKQYVVVATGMEVSASETTDRATRRFLSGPVRDFFLAFCSDPWVNSTAVGDTTIRSYAFAEHAFGGGKSLASGADALGVFNSRFGVYPYRELEILEAPLIGLLGMEYPGVILLANTIYTSDQEWRLDITAAHEVTHQWFYGVVGNDILLEPWLDEALATWASGLYVETVNGQPAFLYQYAGWVERYESGQNNGTAGAVVWPVERFRSSWDYVTTTYYKGAITLKMLRSEIGDDAFFSALRRYYEESRFRLATGQRLLDLFEQESGRDLAAFWREWFFSE